MVRLWVKHNDKRLVNEDEYDLLIARLSRVIRGKEYIAFESEKVKSKVGLVFDDYWHFRRLLKDYVIENGIKQHKMHNDNQRMHALVLPNGKTFMLKKFKSKHICIRQIKDKEVKM